GRRNLLAWVIKMMLDGRISAWAEEPNSRLSSRIAPRAHLRVGGGTATYSLPPMVILGASPRGRRNHDPGVGRGCGAGRISAWAEEPTWPSERVAPAGAHLRVGGGTSSAATPADPAAGASPRGRRNRGLQVGQRACDGRISAWAEEPRGRE